MELEWPHYSFGQDPVNPESQIGRDSSEVPNRLTFEVSDLVRLHPFLKRRQNRNYIGCLPGSLFHEYSSPKRLKQLKGRFHLREAKVEEGSCGDNLVLSSPGGVEVRISNSPYEPKVSFEIDDRFRGSGPAQSLLMRAHKSFLIYSANTDRVRELLRARIETPF